MIVKSASSRSLLCTRKVVPRLPTVPGVKLTAKVVLPFTGTEVTMPVVLTAKSAAFPPVTETPVIDKAALPTFLIVKVRGADVLNAT